MDAMWILVGEDMEMICDAVILELFFDVGLGYLELYRLILPNLFELLIGEVSRWYGSKGGVSKLGVSKHSTRLCGETVSSSFA